MLINVDFASCADDNTPYIGKDAVKDAIEPLEHATVELIQFKSVF